jgi:hypothetical protein
MPKLKHSDIFLNASTGTLRLQTFIPCSDGDGESAVVLQIYPLDFAGILAAMGVADRQITIEAALAFLTLRPPTPPLDTHRPWPPRHEPPRVHLAESEGGSG